MNLTDRTGEINCKIWNWESSAEMPENGSVVKIRGTVQEYNGRLQLRVERWRKAAAEDPVDMNRLVPCAPRKAEDMTAEIRETVESFRSEKLRKLTMGMLENAGGDLSWFPAAQRMHHAERSGLLHHTTDMLRMAKAMLEVYPWLNRDLLLAGVIIHDLGKMDELKSDRAGNVSDYTRDGQLLGHLVRGITNLNRVADRLGIHGETVTLLEHMLISHHGEPEFGAAVLPMCAEAELLHLIDLIDSRMEIYAETLQDLPAGSFSDRIYALEKRIYKLPEAENEKSS
jgi:3'-5' exoribonuclease